MAPNLSAGRGGTYLSWIEPNPAGHTLFVSQLKTGGGAEADDWSKPELITAGDTFFANWADLPGVVEDSNGDRYAHWLTKLGDDTYAYGASLARASANSPDWTPLGLLHDDSSETEHGFVSYVALPNGGVEALWLDGRAMPLAGMQLRTARLDGPMVGSSTVLDEQVCECCSTDSALAEAGPIVVYRDRSDSEIRDISVVRSVDGHWSTPTAIHTDGWEIRGCPVNGPAIAAQGAVVAVAWFTVAEDRTRVQLALSADGGSSFGSPILIDEEAPLGRVDVAITRDGSIAVSWMRSTATGSELVFRWVDPGSDPGPIHHVADSTAARSAGVPKMIDHGEQLLFVWVEDRDPSRLRGRLIGSSPG